MKAFLRTGLLASASCMALTVTAQVSLANDKLIELSKSDENWVMTGKNYDFEQLQPAEADQQGQRQEAEGRLVVLDRVCCTATKARRASSTA